MANYVQKKGFAEHDDINGKIVLLASYRIFENENRLKIAGVMTFLPWREVQNWVNLW